MYPKKIPKDFHLWTDKEKHPRCECFLSTFNFPSGTPNGSNGVGFGIGFGSSEQLRFSPRIRNPRGPR